MPIVDCPHCYKTVAVDPGGYCPACRRNTHDRIGVDPDLALLAVEHGQAFPPWCCRCGERADLEMELDLQEETEAQRETGGVRRLLFFLFNPDLARLIARFRRTRSIQVALPLCESCADLGPPPVEHVDYGNLKANLLVHRRFKARLE